METQELRENINNAVNASGKTKEAIAQELGITYNQLWRLLSGQRRLQADFVAKIAILTGKSPNDLYGKLANPTQSPAKPGARGARTA